MPGLDLTQISSNWKKLQEKLQTTKAPEASQQKNGVKRKRQDVADGKTTIAPRKTARLSDTRSHNPPRTRKMGLYGSKEPAANSGSKASHSALTSQHDISKSDLSAAYGSSASTTTPTQVFADVVNGGLHPTHKAGKYLALDCEMVGTGAPPHYEDHVLARVSLVNFHGEQIYDSYVLPPPNITIHDYRTFVSGILPEHLLPGYARPFKQVQRDVAQLLDGRILVGHALRNDFNVLVLSHPRRDVRDTSRYAPYRAMNRGRAPALRHLAKVKLGLEIQTGAHSSVEDARATMRLFCLEKAGFEEETRKLYGHSASRVVGRGKGGVVKKEDDDGEEEEGDGLDSEEEDLRLLRDEVEGEDDDDLEEGNGAAVSKAPKSVVKKRKKKKRTKRA
ncbi:ribonuclease H-like domain-containing protein [Neohortaea acidophila]|uniref:RNA exonuclease 4 n=1 Tax=Neohortaea acidophila TaxID=245834 RepID=A0A6A6Q6T8_9PEZI|nr:ribonuclease H-like domain-containing protein [Neohortaea acidophila]KAF2488100.1 ribonuclease H-like domain-containing protein [Neohortaea acidophila]